MRASVVAVVRTGTANLASVETALRRLGRLVEFVADGDAVARADRLVLPGVGAFATAREEIAAQGLEDALRERIGEGRPTLAICLGMQLMARGSEEAPGVPGIGALNAVATKFGGGRRVPQMGWNRVVPSDRCRIVPEGFAYFANSYRLPVGARAEAAAACAPTAPAAPSPEPSAGGWLPAWSEYGGPFLAAVERGAVVGCQFHPELSGAYGRALLTRWLAA